MGFKKIVLSLILALMSLSLVSAQENNSDDKKSKNNDKKADKIDLKKGLKTGVQVAEFAIIVYSNSPFGRARLNQIRKTTVEIGKIRVTNPDGSIVNSNYEQKIMRGESLEKERIRLNQKFPDAEYSLIYDGKKTFGLYNDSVFTPREDAVRSFENRIWRGTEALLRYKENGSEVKLENEEKIMGVTLYVVRLTDKDKRETTYYVSKKTLRVMMLTYEDSGVKYRRKFYNHNYAQGILVPYRSVLWANDQVVEEKDISTITFGQTLDEGIFQSTVAEAF